MSTSLLLVVEFIDYPPSAIAAAAVLCAADQYADERILGCFHQRVSRVSTVDSHGFSQQVFLFPHEKMFFCQGKVTKMKVLLGHQWWQITQRTANEFCSIKTENYYIHMFQDLTHS